MKIIFGTIFYILSLLTLSAMCIICSTIVILGFLIDSLFYGRFGNV